MDSTTSKTIYKRVFIIILSREDTEVIPFQVVLEHENYLENVFQQLCLTIMTPEGA